MEETDLSRPRVVHYSPQTGRFISEDPIGFAGEDFNLYRYVDNSPILYTDSLGLMKERSDGGGGGRASAGGTGSFRGRIRVTGRNRGNVKKQAIRVTCEETGNVKEISRDRVKELERNPFSPRRDNPPKTINQGLRNIKFPRNKALDTDRIKRAPTTEELNMLERFFREGI